MKIHTSDGSQGERERESRNGIYHCNSLFKNWPPKARPGTESVSCLSRGAQVTEAQIYSRKANSAWQECQVREPSFHSPRKQLTGEDCGWYEYHLEKGLSRRAEVTPAYFTTEGSECHHLRQGTILDHERNGKHTAWLRTGSNTRVTAATESLKQISSFQENTRV